MGAVQHATKSQHQSLPLPGSELAPQISSPTQAQETEAQTKSGLGIRDLYESPETAARQGGLNLQKSTPDAARMKRFMRTRVVGNEEALDRLVQIVEQHRVGMNNPDRTAGNVMLFGASGTGKSLIAKSLDEYLHGKPVTEGDSKRQMIFLKGGEFKSEASVARLLGSPPGYVGHGKTTPELSEERLERARSEDSNLAVVLVDEFEKAHTAVQDVLLNMMEEGKFSPITPKRQDEHDQSRHNGATIEDVSLKDVLIIVTTNAGAEPFYGLPEGASKAQLQAARQHGAAELNDTYRPEVLGRFDAKIAADPLTERSTLHQIFDMELGKVIKKFGARFGHIDVDVSAEAKDLLIDHVFKAREGARPIRKAVSESISEQILNGLSNGVITEGSSLQLVVSDKKELRWLPGEGDKVPQIDFTDLSQMLSQRHLSGPDMQRLGRRFVTASPTQKVLYGEFARDMANRIDRNDPVSRLELERMINHADQADGRTQRFAEHAYEMAKQAFNTQSLDQAQVGALFSQLQQLPPGQRTALRRAIRDSIFSGAKGRRLKLSDPATEIALTNLLYDPNEPNSASHTLQALLKNAQMGWSFGGKKITSVQLPELLTALKALPEDEFHQQRTELRRRLFSAENRAQMDRASTGALYRALVMDTDLRVASLEAISAEAQRIASAEPISEEEALMLKQRADRLFADGNGLEEAHHIIKESLLSYGKVFRSRANLPRLHRALDEPAPPPPMTASKTQPEALVQTEAKRFSGDQRVYNALLESAASIGPTEHHKIDELFKAIDRRYKKVPKLGAQLKNEIAHKFYIEGARRLASSNDVVKEAHIEAIIRQFGTSIETQRSLLEKVAQIFFPDEAAAME